MTDETDRDPTRDPVLASALRELAPEPPMDEVDWDRLERRISARAREAVAWWQPIAAWARPAIPLGLAAGIALFVVVLRSPADTAESAEPLLLGDELAQSVYQGDSATLLQAALSGEDPNP
ncbi:MAG TPA: hypothetical protein VJP59_02840 [Gemmatimonadota bacterium]|nr:hypothetical protein [Gemmatimonadota bacterium]